MGGSIGKYVLPGLETAGGAATEIFAPGNPLGLALLGSGVGQLGGGAFGHGGQGIGGLLGGLLGGGYGALGMPGMSNLTNFLQAFSPSTSTAAGAQGFSEGAPSTLTEKDIPATDASAVGSEAKGSSEELPPTSVVGGEKQGNKQASDPMQQLMLMSLLSPILGQLMGGTGLMGGGQPQSPQMPQHQPIQATPYAPMQPPSPVVPSKVAGVSMPVLDRTNPDQALLQYLHSQGMLS